MIGEGERVGIMGMVGTVGGGGRGDGVERHHRGRRVWGSIEDEGYTNAEGAAEDTTGWLLTESACV